MPTYEYECKGCGHRFERSQAMAEEPVRECPQCQGQVQRLVSGGAGFILKGSGWTGHGPSGQGDCSLERTGRTCCGQEQRCDKPGCEK